MCFGNKLSIENGRGDMSIKIDVEVQCPKCKGKSMTTIWQAINIPLSPDGKEALLKGEINIFRCPHCGDEEFLDTGLLYHDMEKNFCVKYLPVGELDDVEGLKTTFNEDGKLKIDPAVMGEAPDYFKNTHVVFSMEELRIYVIFRDKLGAPKNK
jgi:hypothetical protein